MPHKKTPTNSKGFKFWLPETKTVITRLEWYDLEDHPKISLRRLRYLRDAQMTEAHDTVSELLKAVDERIKWAKTRSQSERWWDLKIRSCSDHYKLIDEFDVWASRLKSRITWALMSAVWTRLHGEYWSNTYRLLNEANALVDEINGAFR